MCRWWIATLIGVGRARPLESSALVSIMDMDSERQLSSDFGTRSFPALLYFKKGELAGKQVGKQGKAEMVASLAS